MANRVPIYAFPNEIGKPTQFASFQSADTLANDRVDVDDNSFTIISGTNTQAAITSADVSLQNIHDGNHRLVFQGSSTSTHDLNQASLTAIPIDIEDFKDSIFTHSNSTLNSRVTILVDGIYEISYRIAGSQAGNSRKNLGAAYRLNGTTILNRTISYSYSRNTTNDSSLNTCTPILVSFVSGDYLELVTLATGDSGQVLQLTNQTVMRIDLWQVS